MCYKIRRELKRLSFFFEVKKAYDHIKSYKK
jgi:hypothetical protein